MARRGRCRCGCVLTFQRGREGYKTRCPGCQAVVRLGKRGGTPRNRPAVSVPASPVAGVDAEPPTIELEPWPAEPVPNGLLRSLVWLWLGVACVLVVGLVVLLWLTWH
jgi:hypothetical protein